MKILLLIIIEICLAAFILLIIDFRDSFDTQILALSGWFCAFFLSLILYLIKRRDN